MLLDLTQPSRYVFLYFCIASKISEFSFSVMIIFSLVLYYFLQNDSLLTFIEGKKATKIVIRIVLKFIKIKT